MLSENLLIDKNYHPDDSKQVTPNVGHDIPKKTHANFLVPGLQAPVEVYGLTNLSRLFLACFIYFIAGLFD